MPKPSTDIVLTKRQAEIVLDQWLGERAVCSGVEPLSGGMIHSVMRLRFDRPPHDAVIKVSADADGDGFAGEERRLFYWLNTYMIHVWIFGDEPYRASTARVAAEIRRQIP